MDSEELHHKLRLHALWLAGESQGQRLALREANLHGASLRGADLRGADLREAFLQWADLRKVNLRDADLRKADLRWACLQWADLEGVDLEDADLRGADLRLAEFGGSNVKYAVFPHFQIPEGSLIGWKQVQGKIIKLRIPERARRTGTPVGRKCRAEMAEVVSIEGGGPVESRHGCVYREGEEVWPDRYCDDCRVECSNGIHFFLTREEAEEW